MSFIMTRPSPPAEPTAAELQARAARRRKILETQKADAPVAMAEYRAAEQAAREKTARLRAERLKREAAKPGK
ncbi:MAG: hypothetical protein K2Z80_04505 [Xanthobacteraceae bacterium]|nr:hypothetical protein [Xanthobacteraceae bacterium]